ncbi:Metallo-dependent hydrolase [Plenodomus tracheiphilus IPT5]|uniref:Metallo-dependent hydrolase n=1 Tax=Plenodomus tracheiphilus IPT5 TaxID=1408161 RepID=A0A6A7B2D0_9PLEO|nr:Metallo-dependent hydrolase [Plenodomus tracheiphilus IPT5]
MSAEEEVKEEPFPWHLGVYDAHCHPTDRMHTLKTLENMKTRILTVMATRAEDQDLVLTTADKHGIKSSDPSKWTPIERIVPCFGWHPWFAHQMYIPDDETNTSTTDPPKPLTGDAKLTHYQSVLQPSHPNPSPEDLQTLHSLPDPTPFSLFLTQTRAHLASHPYALIGEIGLDRSFRIPTPWSTTSSIWETRNHELTLGGREGRHLTPFRCAPQHQKRIFQLQLRLAGEMGRAVSVHGVQAHGVLLEAMRELWVGYEKKVLSKRERKRRGYDDESVASVSTLEDTNNNNTHTTKQQQTLESNPPPFPPRICLHSYSGPPTHLKQYLHPSIPSQIYISFSTAINLSDALHDPTPPSFEAVVRAVPDHMLLVESDLDRAGDAIDDRLEDMMLDSI